MSCEARPLWAFFPQTVFLEKNIFGAGRLVVSWTTRWGEKIDEDDKETLEEALKEALDWLDDNQDAEREDYVDKRQELEDRWRDAAVERVADLMT